MLFHQNKSTTISNTQEVKAIWISCLVQYEILSDLLQRKYLVDKGKLSNNARLGKLKKIKISETKKLGYIKIGSKFKLTELHLITIKK